METTTVLLCAGVPFAWWGSIVAISVIETPLKFRAPGITVPLALGIGRLVFRALNYLEAVFAIVVVAGLFESATSPRTTSWVLYGTICLILCVQGAWLRPGLDRRSRVLAQGKPLPPSRLHLLYVGGELAKLLALPALAISVVTALPS